MAYKFNPLTGNLDDYGPVLTGTGTVSAAADGTAALPGIAFANDLNTGIYRPGADQLALSTNGTQKLLIDSLGNVTVKGSLGDITLGSGAAISFSRNDANFVSATAGSAAYLNYEAPNLHVFRTGSPTLTERLRITSTGQLSHIGAGSSGSPAVSFSGSAASNSLVVDSSSRVGIGTSAPSTTLHCATNNSSTSVGTSTLTAILQNSNATSGAINGLGFANSGGFYSAAIYTTQAQTGNSGDNLVLNTKTSGGAWNTGVVIDTAGRVGIGTTSFTSGLAINNYLGDDLWAANSTDGLAFNASAGGISTITTYLDNSSIRIGAGVTQKTGILITGQTSTPGSTVQFRTGNNERARIDSSGRLLVGTVSTSSVNRLIVQSSSDAPTGAGTLFLARGDNAPLTTNVLGALRFGGSTHVNSAEISAFRDGGTWTAGSSLPTGLTFSVTRDGQASPTEACRIDSSQRLLIGTSSARTNVGGVTPYVQVEGASSSSNRILSYVYGEASGAASVFAFCKHRGTGIGQNTIVESGDSLGRINFYGADGTNFIIGASVASEVDGTPGANSMPGRIVFSTTANGASSPTERFRITNDGVRGYNQPAPAAVDATATLTVANLKTGIITSSTAAAVTMTLPTGTLTEGGFAANSLYNNFTFEWTVINTGATNAVTVQGGTDHTLVGSGTIAAGVSGRFASRRTATNTFVTYRLS